MRLYQIKFAIPVYIDLNVGMNRTGIAPGKEAIEFINLAVIRREYGQLVCMFMTVTFAILIFNNAQLSVMMPLNRYYKCKDILLKHGFTKPVIVAGGSPTFPVHAKRKEIECSPGTFIYWDNGYQLACKEQAFIPAALVISRVCFFTFRKTKLCLDQGHKSIAAENTLDKRVYFLNAPELKFIGQSEEHLVCTSTIGSFYIKSAMYYMDCLIIFVPLSPCMKER